MAWSKPKTDWQSTDFHELADFTRLHDNIHYIESLYGFPEVELSDITNRSKIYADYFNEIEDAIDILSTNLNIDIGEKKHFDDEGSAIDYEELNRLESALLTFRNAYGTFEILSDRLPLEEEKVKC